MQHGQTGVLTGYYYSAVFGERPAENYIVHVPTRDYEWQDYCRLDAWAMSYIRDSPTQNWIGKQTWRPSSMACSMPSAYVSLTERPQYSRTLNVDSLGVTTPLTRSTRYLDDLCACFVVAYEDVYSENQRENSACL